MAKRKATPPPKATDVEEVKEETEVEEEAANGDDVEMKEDAEAGEEKEAKKDGIPLFIPSLNEFYRELGENYNPRTLMVGPVKFTELNRGKLSIVTQKAEFCQVKLAKQDGVLQGYLELMFESEEQATSCLVELESYKANGVIVKHLKRVEDKAVDIADIRDSLSITSKMDNSSSAAERCIVVTQLPSEVTAEEIKEKIKEATTVVLPCSHVTNERKSYAYVELPYFRNAKYHSGWNLTFGEKKSKCHMLERIPKVGNVIGELKKYQKRVEKKEVLDQTAKQSLKELLNHGVHYERSEYVDDEKKESLKSLMEACRPGMKNSGNKQGKKGNAGGNKGQGMNLSNLGQLDALNLLSALSALNSKKPKMARNQRW